MSRKIRERRFKVPPNLQPGELADMVSKLASSADFYGMSYERGKQLAVKFLEDPNHILEDVVKNPQELYKDLEHLSPVDLSSSPVGRRLTDLLSVAIRSNLRPVCFIVGNLAVFEKWLGVPLSLTKPKPWETETYHFLLLNTPGVVDNTIGESKAVLLLGQDDALTSVNIQRGLYFELDGPETIQETPHERPEPNTGGWTFEQNPSRPWGGRGR